MVSEVETLTSNTQSGHPKGTRNAPRVGTQKVPAILMGFAHTPLGIAMHPVGTRYPVDCGEGELYCLQQRRVVSL